MQASGTRSSMSSMDDIDDVDEESEEEGEADEDAWGASSSGRSGYSSGSWLGSRVAASQPVSMADMHGVGSGRQQERIVLTGRTGLELGRVLAGPASPGLVQGSFVLIGGDPGIGKSTLMLQLAAMASRASLDVDAAAEAVLETTTATRTAAMADAAAAAAAAAAQQQQQQPELVLRRVLYVTGEEKTENVYDRACRMGLGGPSTPSLFLYANDVMEEILDVVKDMRPVLMVVDSIQTMHMRDVTGSPGSVSQVKECGQVLRYIANALGTTVVVVAHVTKSGEVAGPKMLEHMVDTVLFMEGESSEGRRLLRVHKNRNGPTDEVGIFKIDSRGLHAQANPSSLFLDEISTGSGGGAAVLGVCMMGNRAVMLEVQAMCSRAYNTGSPPTRSPSGVSRERFTQLVHVMGKALPSCRALPAHHVYVVVVKGAQFKEPAADLAMAIAIAASFFDAALPAGLAVLGEVDLGGRLRGVGSLEARVLQVAALGLCDRVIVPQRVRLDAMASDSELVLSGKGLTEVPPEASSATTLDISSNLIQSIPEALFPGLTQLVSINLSGNGLDSLPDDISALTALTRLDASHNKLSSLPEGLWKLVGLVELNLGHNKLSVIGGDIVQLSALQALDVSSNDLRVLPPAVGWLPLKSLELSGNARLRVPPVVLDGGFRAVMSYLMVVCEQHRLVEQHLDKFAIPNEEMGCPQVEPITRPEDVPTDAGELAALIDARMAATAISGIADLRYLGTLAAMDRLPGLPAIYIADVRHSGWTEVSAAVLGLPQLVVLNAGHNELTSVADGVTPEHVGVLNLSFNRLASLPAALGASPVLQQMYLANNELENLPDSFSQLPMVDLFLSENKFTTIPKAVFGMAKLSKLSIACCRLTSVPDRLAEVTSLRFLDLSFNLLTTLPDSVAALTSLNALNVSFNPLAGFPGVVTQLTSLLELNLDYCGISSLPPGIGDLRRLEGLQIEGCSLLAPLDAIYAASPLQLVQLHNTTLQSLDLSGLGMAALPEQLSRLTGLKALNLSHNLLTTLSPVLGALTGLTTLTLADNPLVAPYANVRAASGDLALVALCDVTSDTLDLTNCRLEALPEELRARAPQLKALKLGKNKLTALPAWLSECTALTTVVLDNNALGQLPAELLQLPNISIIMASGNTLTSLPENLGDARGLAGLVLQDNQITHLPDSITKLTCLKALSVSHNKLTSLPTGLGSCVALRLLDVCNNVIAPSLPTSLNQCAKLRTLKASHNALTWVSLTGAPSILELSLSDNPLEGLPEGTSLDAADAETVRTLLNALAAAAPKGMPEAGAALVAAAAAVAAVAALTAPPPTEPAATANAPLPADAPDGETAALITRMSSLRLEAQRPVTPPSALPPGAIPTEEAPVAAAERESAAALDAFAFAAANDPSNFLYIKKHNETVAKDPLRSKAKWESIPLMHVPRIIAAISNPPPPPNSASKDGSPTRRPQTMMRFKRVVQQSSMAMHLLNRVNDALVSKAATEQAAADAAAAAQPPPGPSQGQWPPGYGGYPPYGYYPPPPGYGPPPPGQQQQPGGAAAGPPGQWLPPPPPGYWPPPQPGAPPPYPYPGMPPPRGYGGPPGPGGAPPPGHPASAPPGPYGAYPPAFPGYPQGTWPTQAPAPAAPSPKRTFGNKIR
ncbi:hypothetical protein FOA52_014942 [Chlamydomonas sp. UWO 241]|nr:hypothetical protein FOA52_014942 [Chlamydomonas sp. UWO 241]